MLSNCFLGEIDFSDKNPYVVLTHDANLVSVLEVFARGAHRGASGGEASNSTKRGPFIWSQVFIENMEATSTTTGSNLVGMISDKRLVNPKSTYRGSKLEIPRFDEMTPVMNRIATLPA